MNKCARVSILKQRLSVLCVQAFVLVSAFAVTMSVFTPVKLSAQQQYGRKAPITNAQRIVAEKAAAIKPLPDGSIKFAYLADIHIADFDGAPVEDIKASVADINNQPDIQFIIIAGDITEFGSDEEIALASQIFSGFRKPWFILSGNHDSKWSESGCNTFARVFGYEFFDFTVKAGMPGGIRFIGCNSGPNMRMAPALVPRESILTLDSVARTIPAGQPVIFINHYPLDDAMLNWFEVTDILRRMNTQVALCGHGHNNDVFDYNGITGVMGRSNLRNGRQGPGYNIVTVKNGMIDFRERVMPVLPSNARQQTSPFAPGKTLTPWFRLRTCNAQVAGNQDSANGKSDSQLLYERQFIGGTIPPGSARKVRELWSVQDNSDIGSAAVFVNGIVYYANTAGTVKAYDVKSDRLIWKFATQGKVFSSPAVSNDRLVIGSSDNNIYCLDTRTGRPLWRVSAKKSVLASPVIYDGVVYIGASDGVFRAIDLRSGSLRWEFTGVKGFVECKAWADVSGVYFGSWGSEFYALDPKNGNLLWKWTNGKGRGLSPAAVWPVKTPPLKNMHSFAGSLTAKSLEFGQAGQIFFVTPERMTYALDAATGRELWKARGGREAIGMSPDASVVYIKTMQDTLFAYSTHNKSRTGSTYRSRNAQPRPSDQVVGSNGLPAISSAPLLWASHVGFGYEIAPSPIAATQELVFIPTDKGNIFAVNASDGKPVWQYKFSIALINYIQILPGNRLLVSSMDGKVAILEY